MVVTSIPHVVTPSLRSFARHSSAVSFNPLDCRRPQSLDGAKGQKSHKTHMKILSSVVLPTRSRNRTKDKNKRSSQKGTVAVIRPPPSSTHNPNATLVGLNVISLHSPDCDPSPNPPRSSRPSSAPNAGHRPSPRAPLLQPNVPR